MRRWGFLLKMVPVLCLTTATPVFASGLGYGAIPPNYALGLLFIVSIALYSEVRIRSLGIISFFIGAASLFSQKVYESGHLSEKTIYFIIPAAMFLLLGYLVIGRGLAKGTDEETESPLLSGINFLSVVGLFSGVLCLFRRFLHSCFDSDFTSYYTLLVILSSMTVSASLPALMGIIRRNLDYDAQKVPFFYIFNKVIFRPVIYGFIGALSVYFIPFNDEFFIILFFLIHVITLGMVVTDYDRTKKRIANLPRLFCSDYFLIFFLSEVAGNGILLIAGLSFNHHISRIAMQSLLFLPAIAGFSYFAFTLITGKYKNMLSSSLKLLLCFPPILLIILNIAGILPLNMHISCHQCESNLKNLGTALYMYSCDNKGKYPDKLEQLTPKYIGEIPRCTWDLKEDSFVIRYYSKVWGISGNDYVYSTSDGRNRFLMYCSGNSHKDAGIGENFPQYNSETGLVPR